MQKIFSYQQKNSHKFYLYIIMLVAASGTIIQSCKKTTFDNYEVQKEPVNFEKVFFSLPANTSAITVRIAEIIKKQNAMFHFVNNLALKHGLPVWNKAKIQLPKTGAVASIVHGTTNTTNTTNNTNNTNNGEDTVVLIPLVLQNTEFVNGFLACAVGDSVNIRLIDAGEYAQFGFNNIPDSLNANKIALETMLLEKDVFGHDEYQLLDDRLFNHTVNGVTSHPGYFEINNNITTIDSNIAPSLMIGVTNCTEYTTYGGWLTGCPPGANCNNVFTFTVCETTYYWIDVTSGGGGGSGSGTPWWNNGGPIGTPPPNPPSGGVGGAPAWVYVTPPPPTTSPDSVILQKLTAYSIAINPVADSVFQLSMITPQKEYGFIVVKNGNNIYPKNIKTDSLENEVTQNWYLQSTETLLADWHAHPDPSADTNTRPAPSDGDILALNSHGHQSKLNYISFIDCGNVRYAFAIQDVTKANAFFRAINSGRDNILDQYSNLLQANANYNSNYQKAGQETVIAIIGAAALNGIGFYKSTNAAKTQYQKLN